MAITTLDQYIGASKQSVQYVKTASRTTIAAAWFSLFELAGSPGAGTLAGTSTTTGVVPTDTTAGFPLLNFTTGSGYISSVDFSGSVAARIRVYDCLWKGGAYAFNASTTGQTPTSYSTRVPGGTDYTGTQIWVETVTAFTGNQTFNVTYTNQDGTTGKTTGAVGIGAAPTLGRMWQLPLAAGDVGVQGVTGVVGATGTAGTANILVLRPLWTGRVRIANDGDIHGLDKTGMNEIFPTSALFVAIAPDGTSSGIPELSIEVANG
ncbi:hypothetical protein [Leptothrix discophora]|uniref:Minor tail protein n=1 Tax=Leptothrix discophora TaxID=89 RepID=A0ABT9G0I5_LEPDI|nr:hypothetical protein [Leptothrix discophora]MDP4299940.1 hypothetical protein [Leptothrix discophora]